MNIARENFSSATRTPSPQQEEWGDYFYMRENSLYGVLSRALRRRAGSCLIR
jgi:sarcosine oxidase delta subunit